MKPEHSLYKSDGLYYMQNMPEKPVANRSGFGMFNMFEYESKLAEYKAALERAKAEAVLVTDPYVYQIAMHRYFPHFIDYSKTPQDNFAMCASLGQVYILNMEEKIEVYKAYRSFDGVMWGEWIEIGSYDINLPATGKYEFTTFARIAAPKKEEESEEQILSELLNEFHSWCIGISFDPEGKDNRTRDEFIKDKLKAIEIKRKPL